MEPHKDCAGAQRAGCLHVEHVQTTEPAGLRSLIAFLRATLVICRVASGAVAQ